MNADLLLSWMTQSDRGSWSAFRNAVEELAGEEADLIQISRRLRINLSDLGFAKFFVDDTQEWRVFPAVLAQLAGRPDKGTLLGGRSPSVVETLNAATEAIGCQMSREVYDNCPTLIEISGTPKQLEEVASQVGLTFDGRYAGSFLATLGTVSAQLDAAIPADTPRNWKARSFCFDAKEWVDGLKPDSACEFAPTHGQPRYFLSKKRGRLYRFGKREAVYASAFFHGVRLADYEPNFKALSVPFYAPLPEDFARIACLCSGRPAKADGGRFVYENVPPEIGAILVVGLGQPHPMQSAVLK